MITFIIRRLIATVFLLIVVSMITFAIFFLHAAAGRAEHLPARHPVRGAQPNAGRPCTRSSSNSAWTSRSTVQYGRFLKGIVLGAHFNSGTNSAYCPPPCFGYSFRNQQPVWPQMVSDLPGDPVAGHRGGDIWLVAGVSIGVISALQAGHPVRPVLDGRRAGRGVAADLLHRADLAGAVQLQVADLPERHVRPFTQNPLLWARNLVLPWIRLAFLYAALYARLTGRACWRR